MTGIGTLQENSLHASLKNWYLQPGDALESKVDGYVIDIVRPNELIEVQTANFSKIKRKLVKLLENHRVRLIYPIAVEKWILRLSGDNTTILSRRKSPKRGRIMDLFQELVRIPSLVKNPNFTLEVVYIQEEVVWREDGRGSWRRKGRSIADRRLIEVMSRDEFSSPDDFRKLIPPVMPVTFTVKELATYSSQPRHLASKMAYCLREMGLIEIVGKRGRARLYRCLT